MDPRAGAGVQPLVVRGVVPREHHRVHRVGVERANVVDGRLGLFRADGHRAAVGGHLLGPEAPEDRRQRGDGVRRLADGEADRVTELLERASGAKQVLPGVGGFLADFLEEIDAVAAGERQIEIGDAEPPALDVRVLFRERIPLAVLGGEVVGEVGDVGESGREEPRVVHLEAHDVVAALRHELGRQLRGHLHALHVVRAHADAGGLREPTAELGELDVGGRGVVDGRQQRELARGPRGRWTAQGKDPGDARRGRPGERAAGDGRARSRGGRLRCRLGHRAPPAGQSRVVRESSRFGKGLPACPSAVIESDDPG